MIDAEPPALKQMIEAYEQTGSSILATMEVNGPAISSYGVIDAEPVDGNNRLFKVKDMVEKPKKEEAPSNLAIIGRYILTPAIFEQLEQTPLGAIGELQLTDGIRRLLQQESVYGYRFEGKRHDAGDKLGFLQATVEYALKRNDLGPQFREYLKSLQI
jgi:UTP--glucose-1-phosphate uridylyltransferase